MAALKDRYSFGVALPHRASTSIDVNLIRDVARRAETLGFRDLWVTENTLDHVFSIDAMVALSYAAAITDSIRLGVAVVVLPVHSPIHIAHQAASLDYLSGGRAVLAVGLGREEHYREFQVPTERRVRRLLEGIGLMRTLWAQDPVDFDGDIFRLHNGRMILKPVQSPMPLWLSGLHPDAVRRAARHGDGWMGAGAQSTSDFGRSVAMLREEIEGCGKDPSTYPISKRVFLAVDEDPRAAKRLVEDWFGDVYNNRSAGDTCGLSGTVEQVHELLEELMAAGANHLLLNAAGNHLEQVEALAEVVGRH